MNREIKLRAWSNVFDRMSYKLKVETILTDTVHSSMTVMQCIDIEDKKGNPIYESDIIKTPNGDWGVIVWGAPFFQVTVDKEGNPSLYTKEWLQQCEVLGNIHENPDFLKKS